MPDMIVNLTSVINMKFKKIITIVLILVVIGITVPAGYMDYSAPEESSATSKCGDLPAFTELYTTLTEAIDSGKKKLNSSTINEAYQEAQVKYHKYAECVFTFTESVIYQNTGWIQGTGQAYDPEFPWFEPEASCLTQDKLNEVITSTGPTQTLPILLEVNKRYGDHLDNLVSLYQGQGVETEDSEGGVLDALEAFKTGIAEANKFEKKVKVEKENTLVAMDITFKTIKELRLAFVMHIHFQCMLNNLDKYRTLLGDIRRIIQNLPNRLEDASMSK